MDGWATTGSTTARFASRTCLTSLNRKPLANRKRNGGPATSTTMTNTCRPARRGKRGGSTVLNTVAAGGNLLGRRDMTRVLRGQRWVAFVAHNPLTERGGG